MAHWALGVRRAGRVGAGGSTDVGYVTASDSLGRDPWAEALGSSAFRSTANPLEPQRAPGLGGLKEKDLSSIDKFDGTMVRYADWADRMLAKLRRQCPGIADVLKWAEEQTEQITQDIEKSHAEFGIDLVDASGVLADLLMAKTTPALYDKRKNAGDGRGLEFWRVLKRDFGMASADAQLAKLQLYMRPVKATMAT